MAETYTFPTDFPEPNIASSSGAGDSYKDKLQDSTISVTSDANYKKTRPRTTRMVETWTYTWVGVNDADFAKLQAFFRKVGTFQQFAWRDWNGGRRRNGRDAWNGRYSSRRRGLWHGSWCRWGRWPALP